MSLLTIAHGRWMRDIEDQANRMWKQRADRVHDYLYAATQVLSGEDRAEADRLLQPLDLRIAIYCKAELDAIVRQCHA